MKDRRTVEVLKWAVLVPLAVVLVTVNALWWFTDAPLVNSVAGLTTPLAGMGFALLAIAQGLRALSKPTRQP